MKRLLKMSAIALLALSTVAPMAAAQRRAIIVRRSPVVVFRGGYYDPWWYNPWYPYGPYYGPYYAPNSGEVKIKTDMKNAQVYVDGGYVGTAREIKNFPLSAGTHQIELRDSEGRTFFRESVNVIAGRTIKINAGNIRG